MNFSSKSTARFLQSWLPFVKRESVLSRLDRSQLAPPGVRIYNLLEEQREQWQIVQERRMAATRESR
ncbi:MAG: hypothetical protein M0Z94_05355 [Dehalococcoidales bacterium]|nr:hypothetical protein [Dehalococcoidales bacterium]